MPHPVELLLAPARAAYPLASASLGVYVAVVERFYPDAPPPPGVPSVTLVVSEVGTGKTLRNVVDGDTLKPGETVVGISDAPAVRFWLNRVGAPLVEPSAIDRVETVRPLTLSTDDNGRPKPLLVPAGSYQLSARGFASAALAKIGLDGGEFVVARVTIAPVIGTPDPEPPPTGELPPLPAGAKRHQVRKGEQPPATLGTGDQLLLERGGSWRRQFNVAVSGIVIGAWGTGAPPKISPESSHGIHFTKPCSDVLVQDVHIVREGGTSGNAAIYLSAAVKNLTVRRVLLRGFSNGVTYAHKPIGGLSEHHRWSDGVSADNIGSGYLGQGVYGAFARDVTWERWAFVGNGWESDKTNAKRSMFEHAAYANGSLMRDKANGPIYDTGARDWKFLACLAIRNGFMGFQVRPDGGAVRGCCMIDQPIGALLNGPEHTAFVGNAVISGGAAAGYGGEKHGTGGLDFHSQGVIAGNVFALPPGASKGVDVPHPCLNIGPRSKDPNQGWPWEGDVSAEGADNHAFGWADAQVIRKGNRTNIDKLNVQRHAACPALDGSWVKTLVDRLRAGDVAAADAAPHVKRVREWVGLN